MNVAFSKQTLENIQIPNFTIICPGKAELFHADGQTDMIKLRVAFCKFANTP